MPYDIALVDGDLPDKTRHIQGVDLVAQRLRIRLAVHRGEYLLDRRVGMPFRRWRAQKPPRLSEIQRFISATILDTPGVDDVREMNAEMVDRRIRVTGRIIVEEADEDIEMELVSAEEGNVSPTIALTLATSRSIL